MYEPIQDNEEELRNLTKKELVNKVLFDTQRERNYILSYNNLRHEYEAYKKKMGERLERVKTAHSLSKASINILDTLLE